MGKNQSPQTQYDALIIGGGLAGMTTACMLGVSGLRVACIDQAPPLDLRADHADLGDLRTTAISYGSQKILARAGLWDDLATQACPIRDIRILDGGSSLLLHFLSAEVEDNAFGWIVENTQLRRAMLRRMAALPAVTHIAPQRVTDFSVSEHEACAVLEDGRRLFAPLIIGADGRNSVLRRWMGVRTRGWTYRQRAVICNVAHENPHHNIAVEHFWPQGPFAILPMTDDAQGRHRSSVVFTEHGPEKTSLMSLSDEAFLAALAARFPAEYGGISMLNARQCYPLSLVHAAEYIRPRMALVADAAHGIHPIAGQGLNLGFRDIEALCDLVIKAHKTGADIGATDLLQTYQRRRRPDNTAMIAFTDTMVRLFSNNIAPVRALRRAGLRAVSRWPAAKRFFMHQAMGGHKS